MLALAPVGMTFIVITYCAYLGVHAKRLHAKFCILTVFSPARHIYNIYHISDCQDVHVFLHSLSLAHGELQLQTVLFFNFFNSKALQRATNSSAVSGTCSNTEDKRKTHVHPRSPEQNRSRNINHSVRRLINTKRLGTCEICSTLSHSNMLWNLSRDP